MTSEILIMNNNAIVMAADIVKDYQKKLLKLKKRIEEKWKSIIKRGYKHDRICTCKQGHKKRRYL